MSVSVPLKPSQRMEKRQGCCGCMQSAPPPPPAAYSFSPTSETYIRFFTISSLLSLSPPHLHTHISVRFRFSRIGAAVSLRAPLLRRLRYKGTTSPTAATTVNLTRHSSCRPIVEAESPSRAHSEVLQPSCRSLHC